MTVRVGTAFEVTNFLRDAGGLDMVAGTLESFFNKVKFGTYLGEAFVKLVPLVIEVAESLDLCELIPVIQLGNGITEGMEGWSGAVE